jgi:hypothetical protein
MFQNTIITYFKAFLVYYFRLALKKEMTKEALDFIDNHVKKFPIPTINLTASNAPIIGKYLADLMVLITQKYGE